MACLLAGSGGSVSRVRKSPVVYTMCAAGDFLAERGLGLGRWVGVHAALGGSVTVQPWGYWSGTVDSDPEISIQVGEGVDRLWKP